MKKQLRKLLLLVVAAFFAGCGYAHDVEIDGIFYNLDAVHKTASVTFEGSVYFSTNEYTGDIIIPESFTYKWSTFTVTSIGNSAFRSCSDLTSVTIPSTVESIGNSAFDHCSNLVSVTIPEGLVSVGNYVFDGCSNLTSLTFPASMMNIGNNLFNLDYKLMAINISPDNSVYSSVDGILYNKEQTEILQCPRGKAGEVIIPSSVTNIKTHAFFDCRYLTSITVPESVTSIGNSTFGYCTLNALYLYAKLSSDYSCFSNLNASSVVYAYDSEINAIRNYWPGVVTDIEKPFGISVQTTNLGGLLFFLAANAYVPAIMQNVKFENTEITPDENGLYTVTGLEPDTLYGIKVTYQTPGGEENSYTHMVRTGKPNVTASHDYTQTTMTVWVDASYDETCSADKKGIYYDGNEYYCTRGKVELRGLQPNKAYDIVPFAEYGTKRFIGEHKSLSTASLRPAINPQYIGPTSISVKGTYVAGNAHVSETGFTDYGVGNTLVLTGLTPNTSYTVSYYVRTEEGSDETVKQTFTTPALNLVTLQPRGVSSTCAIVSADTNIGEDEVNAGFQWKKYDAPESLKPNEGYAAVYGGQLEGYIRNLQSTSYYNVRAFYKSAEGKYYYGDWVTFDPSDFSYFEPTVHTYAATELTHSSARVRGYVLAGTDDIEEQGFEYWPVSDSEVNALRVKEAVTDDSNVQTVLATGQVMTAELRDLRPGTTYSCRAFVKTATRTTYGETQTFTTEGDPTGIDDITIDTPAAMPTVTGYYDLSGRKSDTPHHGVNIVRYSDGTARKVIMK